MKWHQVGPTSYLILKSITLAFVSPYKNEFHVRSPFLDQDYISAQNEIEAKAVAEGIVKGFLSNALATIS